MIDKRSKAVLEDNKLSLAAKSIYMLSQYVTPIFLFELKFIKESCCDDDATIYAAIMELAKAGYLDMKHIDVFINEPYGK